MHNLPIILSRRLYHETSTHIYQASSTKFWPTKRLIYAYSWKFGQHWGQSMHTLESNVEKCHWKKKISGRWFPCLPLPIKEEKHTQKELTVAIYHQLGAKYMPNSIWQKNQSWGESIKKSIVRKTPIFQEYVYKTPII